MASSKKTFTDTGEESDFARIKRDVIAYGVEEFEQKRPDGIDESVVYSGEEIKKMTDSPKSYETYAEIVDLIVQKSGNIRMMVRFNATPIDGKTVTESYDIPGSEENALDYSSERRFRGYSLDPDEDIKTTLYCNRTFRKGHSRKLNFERVFLEEDQRSVYDSLKSFVFSAQNGKPLGIFAYGGTGSGKTHTLLGPSDRTEENEGILGRVVRDLWSSGDVKLEVRMLEIHPSVTTSNNVNKEFSVIGAIEYRCLDLVNLRNNTNLTINGKGQVAYRQKSKNNYVEYFELAIYPNENRDKTQYMVKNRALFTPFENVYDTKNASRSSSQNRTQYTREEFIDKAQETLQFDTSDEETNIEKIMNDINDTIAYRRSISTSGNKSGSSRSHLVITLDVTRPGKNQSDRIYVVDMAGKEYAEENRPKGFTQAVDSDPDIVNWSLSRGINLSLDGFMRLVAVTKCMRTPRKPLFNAFSLERGDAANIYKAHHYLHDNKCNAEHEYMPHADDFKKTLRGVSMEVNYVNDKATPFQKIFYKDDPMTFITKDLWTDKDSKIMLFACMYPLAQINVEDGTDKSGNRIWKRFPNDSMPSSVDVGQQKEDAWDRHFKLRKNEESLHNKFIRDLGILREMDYVQKIGKKE